MKNIFTLIVVFSCFNIAFSQEEKCSINRNYTQNAQFFFNSFQNGSVVFKDGNITDAILNYNVLSNDIFYIENAKYYSLDMNDVKYVLICNHRFYYYKVKIEELIYNKEIQILIERNFNIEQFQDKKGAYGATSPNTVGTNLTTIDISNLPDDGSFRINLKTEEDKKIDITCLHKIMYGNKILPATKKSFLKIYSEHKVNLKKYFNENKFDFHDINDLIEISDYCMSL